MKTLGEVAMNGAKKTSLFFFIFSLLLLSTASATVTWNKPAQNQTTLSGTASLNVSVDTTSITNDANTTFYFWNSSSVWEKIKNSSTRTLPASFEVTWDTTAADDGTDIQLNATAYNGTDYDYNTTWYVNVDNTPPSVNITSPTGSYSKSQIDINATITDSISSVDKVLAEIDSSRNITLVSGTGDTYYNDTYTFTDGDHTVKIYANDTQGNMNDTQSTTFSVDTPPSIYDVDGINNTYYKNETVQSETFQFNATDGNGVDADTLEISLNYSGNNHTFKYPENDSEISRTGSDTSYIFTLDLNDTWTDYGNISRAPKGRDVIQFGIKVEDDNGNIADKPDFLSINVDGSPPQYQNRTPESNGFTNDPQQNISTNITDFAGVNESTFSITVKNSTGYKFLDGSNTSSDHVSWSSGILKIIPSNGSAPFSFNNNTITTTISVNDTLDRQSSTTWNFTVDTLAPDNLTLDAPTSQVQKLADSTLEVSYSYDEKYPGTTNITLADGTGNNVTYVINDSTYAGNNTTNSVTLDLGNPNATGGQGLVHDTVYDIYIKTSDQAGNSKEKTQDNNLLKIFDMEFDQDYYSLGDEVMVSVYDNTSNLGTSDIDQISVKVNDTKGEGHEDLTLNETGVNTGRFAGNFTLNRTGNVNPSDGKLPVQDTDTINAFYSGYSGSASATVDDVAPYDLSITQPGNLKYKTSADGGNVTLVVNYNYTEEGAGADTVSVAVTSGTFTKSFSDSAVNSSTGSISNGTTLNLNNTEISEGLYNLNLSITDKAGNFNSTEVSSILRIDNTHPNASNPSFTKNIKTTKEERSVNVTISDNVVLNSSLDFYLHYNISSGVRQDAVLMSNVTPYGKSVILTAKINESGANSTDIVSYWANGTDLAENSLDGGSYTDPLASYTVDTEPPSDPENLEATNQSCGVKLNWDQAVDDATAVDKYMVYRINGSSVKNIGNTTGAKNTSYTDYVQRGTYQYNVTAVDTVGHEGKATSTVGGKSKYGTIEFNFTTNFEKVYQTSDDNIRSNRTVKVQVSDNCENEWGSGLPSKGNLLNGTDVNVTFVSGLNNVTLTPNQTTTNNTAWANSTISAPFGSGWVNITTAADINGRKTGTLNLYLEEHTISLSSGWNFISLPIIPDDPTVENVMNGLSGAELQTIWSYDSQSGNWSIYNPDKPQNSLDELTADKGYWFNVSGSGSLKVTGKLAEITKPGQEDFFPKNITLYEGWNAIGFREWMDISKYFSKFGNITAYEYNSVNEQGGIYTSTNATKTELGVGYWTKLSENKTVVVADLRTL